MIREILQQTISNGKILLSLMKNCIKNGCVTVKYISLGNITIFNLNAKIYIIFHNNNKCTQKFID